MPAATDAQSLTTAAEQAAAGGDFATAEEYLRLTVELQESTVGPIHPDLANTLNNLGVVYERLDRPADAERCYRRAHAIAGEVFDADHPFVALSAKNLREFCEARGIPIEPPAVEPAAALAPAAAIEPAAVGPEFPPSPRLRRDLDEAQRAESGSPATEDAAADVSSPSQPASRIMSRFALAAFLGVAAIVAIVLVRDRSQSTSGLSESRQPTPKAAEAPPPHVTTDAPDAPVARAAPVAPPDGRVASPKRSTPTLSEAAVCRTVEIRAGEWQCDPAGAAAEPGTLFFYTRVASSGDAMIEHRWYRNNRLYQRVPLRVRANQRGFRTYSRMTIGPERAGDWRVELRTADGALLHEERFTVGH